MPEEPLSRFALYAARPTLRINAEENERASGLMTAMEMREQESGMSTLEMHFGNIAADGIGGADLAFEDEQSFKLGDRIAVYAGQEEGPTEIFSGLITAVEAEFSEEGAPKIVALAEDLLQKARMNRRTRTYEDQTLAQIARSLAQDLSLTPQITGFSESIGVQIQFNESDLAFLRRLLERYDGDLQVVGEELHVSPRAEVQRGRVELALHSQLRRARASADLAHQVNEVTVTGWDAVRGRRLTGRSNGADQGPGRGRSGAALLEESIGRRSHQIGHMAVGTTEEADAVAQAAYDRRRRRFVCLDGTAEGNPNIRVGTHVVLTGLGPRFSNTYYVTSCCHRYDEQTGYETDFTGECAFLGAP